MPPPVNGSHRSLAGQVSCPHPLQKDSSTAPGIGNSGQLMLLPQVEWSIRTDNARGCSSGDNERGKQNLVLDANGASCVSTFSV